jgi:hypothetical protein
MDKLSVNKATLALAMVAVLFTFAGFSGAILTSAQISSSSSQATSTSRNAMTTGNTITAADNNTAASGNNTMVSSMQKICSISENNGTGAAAAAGMSNNTTSGNNTTITGVNDGGDNSTMSTSTTTATNVSDGTMQGRPDPTNITTSTAGNNTTSPSGGNLTAIGKSIGQARIQLLEGCNAINNGDNKSALMHFNLVARSLDNIEGNLTSTIIDTSEENTTTSVPPTGGTSASSVGNKTILSHPARSKVAKYSMGIY